MSTLQQALIENGLSTRKAKHVKRNAQARTVVINKADKNKPIKITEPLRRMQLIVLIKTNCQRLDYKPPSDKVMQRWDISYLAYVLNSLKNLNEIGANRTLRSRWMPYSH